MSSWLECIPKDRTVEFIVVEDGDELVSCFFLGITKEVQNKFYKKRAYLNCLGDYSLDSIVIEYNTILCRKGYNAQDIINFVTNDLKDIEEFRFHLNTDLDFSNEPNYFQRTEKFGSYWTNLEKIQSDDEYLALISKNKRSQIKRSIKEYEKQGSIKIEFAKDLGQAKDYLKELESLHQKEWVKRGEAGAFSNSFFVNFHTKLIERCFDQNEVMLCRIFTESEDIGYFYYFIHNNEALFYQSGLNYKENNKYRPGLVSHFIATNYFSKNNYDKYNFLAGGSQYKRSLSTNHDQLNTLTVSRKSLKSRIEHLLRSQRKKYV